MSQEVVDEKFAEARERDQNRYSCNIVAGYIYNKASKVFKDSFTEIYEDLLNRISEDYKIPLDELKKRYPMKVNITRKKKVDPAEACIAFTKKGHQCTFPRKDGYDYCGVHLKKIMNNPDLPVPPPNNQKATSTSYSERNRPSARTNGTYVPKSEAELEKKDRERRQELAEREKEREENRRVEAETLASEHDEDEDDEVEVELEEIEGKEYLVCGVNIFNYPSDFDISTMSLGDLDKVAIKEKDGTITWFNNDI